MPGSMSEQAIENQEFDQILQAKRVSVIGTPNVAVTNTPSVTVSGTPSVSVSNSPQVSLDASTLASLNATGTMQMAGNSFRNIAGAATTVVKSGAGVLVGIVISRPISLGVITIYDNTAASGTKIATMTNPLALLQQQASLDFGLTFATGLTVVTSAADDLTVIYR